VSGNVGRDPNPSSEPTLLNPVTVEAIAMGQAGSRNRFKALGLP